MIMIHCTSTVQMTEETESHANKSHKNANLIWQLVSHTFHDAIQPI